MGISKTSRDPHYQCQTNTLKEFLYLIRYQDISNEDFFEKIVPYQMFSPKDLWDNVLRYYLVPGRQQTLNLLPSRKSKFTTTYSRLESTTIINQKLILLFASWIVKKAHHIVFSEKLNMNLNFYIVVVEMV